MRPDLVSVEQLDGATVVALRGDLSLDSVRGLIELLGGLIAQGNRQIIIDLQKVFFLTSTIIGRLVALAEKLRRHGGELRICCVPRAIQELFGILHLSAVISIYKDRHAALLACPAEVKLRLGIRDRRSGPDRRKAQLPFQGPDRRVSDRRGAARTPRKSHRGTETPRN